MKHILFIVVCVVLTGILGFVSCCGGLIIYRFFENVVPDTAYIIMWIAVWLALTGLGCRSVYRGMYVPVKTPANESNGPGDT